MTRVYFEAGAEMNAITNLITPIDAQNTDPHYRQDVVSTIVSLLASPEALEVIGYDQLISQLFSLEIAITIAIHLESNQFIDPANWQAISSLVNLHFQQQPPQLLEPQHSSNKPYQNLIKFVAKQIRQNNWQQLAKLSRLPNYSQYADQSGSFSSLWLDLIEMIDILNNQELSDNQLTDLHNTLIILTNCLIEHYL